MGRFDHSEGRLPRPNSRIFGSKLTFLDAYRRSHPRSGSKNATSRPGHTEKPRLAPLQTNFTTSGAKPTDLNAYRRGRDALNGTVIGLQVSEWIASAVMICVLLFLLRVV